MFGIFGKRCIFASSSTYNDTMSTMRTATPPPIRLDINQLRLSIANGATFSCVLPPSLAEKRGCKTCFV